MSRKTYTIIFLVLAFVGLLDAVYLTSETLLHREVYCSVISGCNLVLGSRYAHVGPIPVSAFGAAYYLVMIALSGLVLQQGKDVWRRMIKYFSWIGLIVSAVLVFLMLAVIKSICIYCLTSAAICTLLFLIAQFGINKKEGIENDIKL